MEHSSDRILTALLTIDLRFNAAKLGFIDSGDYEIDQEFIGDTIDALNKLSTENTDVSRRQLIGISSLIWTYSGATWPGLKNYLILFLSRAGFAPSSIMIDNEYDRAERKYSASPSFINQVAITVKQSEFEIKIQDRVFLLTDFQKDVWDNLDQNKLIGISAPTSAGKSHIILLKAVDLLIKRPGAILYVVPTLSLVSQVAQDFRRTLNEFGLTEFRIETSIDLTANPAKTIFVVTQEKAIGAFSQLEPPISEIRCLVIDEIQNIERVADWADQRAKVLFDLMIEFKNQISVDHIILAGPRIENISELGVQIFDVNGYTSVTKSSPVMSITYSISRDKKGYSFNLYSDLLANPIKVKVKDGVVIEGYGKKQYTNEYLSFLKSFLSRIGSSQSNIIFSPTTDTSRKIAEAIIENDNRNVIDNDLLKSLSDYLAKTVNPNFSLCSTVLKGTAYHHGKLPHHVRVVIEDCIRNQKIKNVVCTTTLLQGVNLPIQNIIIRNPDLVIRSKSDSAKLTPYEIANLRGRAGRLLKDFIGRTFILNEDSFRDSDQEHQPTLFKDETKKLKAGYKERFDEFKESIKGDLLTDNGQQTSNQEFSYLTTYIRQSILRYGLNSSLFLSRVGIDLSDEEIQDTYNLLLKLDLPKELYLTNRYWDPFDLALLRRKTRAISLPVSIFQDKMAYQIKNAIEFFRENLPIYFNRYTPIEDRDNHLLAKCIMAENWMKEKTLSEILDPKYYKTSSRIEDSIKFVQNTVSFGMPMLFKPLYDVKGESYFIPRCMELGAYHQVTRKLIELDIPRETAIRIGKTIGPSTNIEDIALIREVGRIKPTLSYWEQIQLQTIC